MSLGKKSQPERTPWERPPAGRRTPVCSGQEDGCPLAWMTFSVSSPLGFSSGGKGEACQAPVFLGFMGFQGFERLTLSWKSGPSSQRLWPYPKPHPRQGLVWSNLKPIHPFPSPGQGPSVDHMLGMHIDTCMAIQCLEFPSLNPSHSSHCHLGRRPAVSVGEHPYFTDSLSCLVSSMS